MPKMKKLGIKENFYYLVLLFCILRVVRSSENTISCIFDTSLCGWSDNGWSRVTRDPGPFSIPNWRTESNFLLANKHGANLTTNYFTLSEPTEFSFLFSFGQTDGVKRLALQAQYESGAKFLLWSADYTSGFTPRKWNNEVIKISFNQRIRLIFEASTRLPGTKIALANFRLENEETIVNTSPIPFTGRIDTAPVSSLDLSCSFDNDFCSWKNEQGEENRMPIGRVHDTQGLGPFDLPAPPDGSYYAFINSNNRKTGSDIAALESPVVEIASNNVTMDFQLGYRLGSDIEIKLEFIDGMEFVLWSSAEQQFNAVVWKTQKIQMPIGMYKIKFNFGFTFPNQYIGLNYIKLSKKVKLYNPITCQIADQDCAWYASTENSWQRNPTSIESTPFAQNFSLASDKNIFVALADERENGSSISSLTSAILLTNSPTDLKFSYFTTPYVTSFKLWATLQNKEKFILWQAENLISNTNKWFNQSVEVCFGSDFSLSFDAQFSQPNAFVAVSNLILVNESKVTHGEPYSKCGAHQVESDCDFSNGLCSWIVAKNSLPWNTMLSGAELQKNYGIPPLPSGGYVAFTGGDEDDSSSKLSIPSQITDSPHFVTFDYFLSGPSTFAVRIKGVNKDLYPDGYLQVIDQIEAPTLRDGATPTWKQAKFSMPSNSKLLTKWLTLEVTFKSQSSKLAIGPITTSTSVSQSLSNITCSFNNFDMCKWHNTHGFQQLYLPLTVNSVPISSDGSNTALVTMSNQETTGLNVSSVDVDITYGIHETSVSFKYLATSSKIEWIRLVVAEKGFRYELGRVASNNGATFNGKWNVFPLTKICLKEYGKLSIEVKFSDSAESAVAIKDFVVGNSSSIINSAVQTPPVCPWIQPKLACSFENDFCSWKPEPSTWGRALNSFGPISLSSDTGNNYFAYLQLNESLRSNSFLLSPSVSINSSTTITFTMAATENVGLILYAVYEDGDNRTISKFNSLNPTFEAYSADVPADLLNTAFSLHIQPQWLKSSANPILAISSIQFKPENSIEDPATTLDRVTCYFQDSTFCGWRNESENKWYAVHVPKQSGVFEIPGYPGRKQYIEASANKRQMGNSLSTIMSSRILLNNETSLAFKYYLTAGVEFLRVVIQDKDNYMHEIYRVKGEPGKWNEVNFGEVLISQNTPFYIRIEAAFNLPDAKVGLQEIILQNETSVRANKTFSSELIPFPVQRSCQFTYDTCSWNGKIDSPLKWVSTLGNSLNISSPEGSYFLTTESKNGNDVAILNLPYHYISDAQKIKFNVVGTSVNTGNMSLSVIDAKTGQSRKLFEQPLTPSWNEHEISMPKTGYLGFVIEVKFAPNARGESVGLDNVQFKQNDVYSVKESITCDFSWRSTCGWTKSSNSISWDVTSEIKKGLFETLPSNSNALSSTYYAVARANSRTKGNSVAQLVSGEINLKNATILSLDVLMPGGVEYLKIRYKTNSSHIYDLQKISNPLSGPFSTYLCINEPFRLIIEVAFSLPDSFVALSGIQLNNENEVRSKSGPIIPSLACDAQVGSIDCNFEYGSCQWLAPSWTIQLGVAQHGGYALTANHSSSFSDSYIMSSPMVIREKPLQMSISHSQSDSGVEQLSVLVSKTNMLNTATLLLHKENFEPSGKWENENVNITITGSYFVWIVVKFKSEGNFWLESISSRLVPSLMNEEAALTCDFIYGDACGWKKTFLNSPFIVENNSVLVAETNTQGNSLFVMESPTITQSGPSSIQLKYMTSDYGVEYFRLVMEDKKGYKYELWRDQLNSTNFTTSAVIPLEYDFPYILALEAAFKKPDAYAQIDSIFVPNEGLVRNDKPYNGSILEAPVIRNCSFEYDLCSWKVGFIENDWKTLPWEIVGPDSSQNIETYHAVCRANTTSGEDVADYAVLSMPTFRFGKPQKFSLKYRVNDENENLTVRVKAGNFIQRDFNVTNRNIGAWVETSQILPFAENVQVEIFSKLNTTGSQIMLEKSAFEDVDTIPLTNRLSCDFKWGTTCGWQNALSGFENSMRWKVNKVGHDFEIEANADNRRTGNSVARLKSKQMVLLQRNTSLLVTFSTSGNGVAFTRVVMRYLDNSTTDDATFYLGEGAIDIPVIKNKLRIPLSYKKPFNLFIETAFYLPSAWVKIKSIELLDEDIVRSLNMSTTLPTMQPPVQVSCDFRYDTCSWNTEMGLPWQIALNATGTEPYLIPTYKSRYYLVTEATSDNNSEYDSILSLPTSYEYLSPFELSFDYASTPTGIDSFVLLISVNNNTAQTGVYTKAIPIALEAGSAWKSFSYIIDPVEKNVGVTIGLAVNFTVKHAKLGIANVQMKEIDIYPSTEKVTCDFKWGRAIGACGWKTAHGSVNVGNSLTTTPPVFNPIKNIDLNTFYLFAEANGRENGSNIQSFYSPVVELNSSTSFSFKYMLNNVGTQAIYLTAVMEDTGYRYPLVHIDATEVPPTKVQAVSTPLCFQEKFRLYIDVVFNLPDSVVAFPSFELENEDVSRVSPNGQRIPGFTCPLVTRPTLNCTLEDNSCSWKFDTIFDRVLKLETSEKIIRKPDGGYFFAANIASPETITIETPPMVLTEPQKLVFGIYTSDYAGFDTISVSTNRNNDSETLINILSKDYSNSWVQHETYLRDTNRTIQVKFTIRSKQPNTVVALSFFTVHPSPELLPYEELVSCSFQFADTCGWRNENDDSSSKPNNWFVQRNQENVGPDYFNASRALVSLSNNMQDGNSLSRVVSPKFTLSNATNLSITYQTSGSNIVFFRLVVYMSDYQYILADLPTPPDSTMQVFTQPLCFDASVGDIRLGLEATYNAPGEFVAIEKIVLVNEELLREGEPFIDSNNECKAKKCIPKVSLTCDFSYDFCSWLPLGLSMWNRRLAEMGKTFDGGYVAFSNGSDASLLSASFVADEVFNVSLSYSLSKNQVINVRKSVSENEGISVRAVFNGDIDGKGVLLYNSSEITNAAKNISLRIPNLLKGVRMQLKIEVSKSYVLGLSSVVLNETAVTIDNVANKRVSCGFEADTCGWSTENWTLSHGFENSLLGPTSAVFGDTFAVAQSNERTFGNQLFKLRTVNIGLKQPSEISFDAYAKGSGIAFLRMILHNDTDNTRYVIWEAPIDGVESGWKSFTVPICARGLFDLTIEAAFTLPGFSVSIDNLILFEEESVRTEVISETWKGVCPLLQPEISCNFEYDFCSWGVKLPVIEKYPMFANWTRAFKTINSNNKTLISSYNGGYMAYVKLDEHNWASFISTPYFLTNSVSELTVKFQWAHEGDENAKYDVTAELNLFTNKHLVNKWSSTYSNGDNSGSMVMRANLPSKLSANAAVQEHVKNTTIYEENPIYLTINVNTSMLFEKIPVYFAIEEILFKEKTIDYELSCDFHDGTFCSWNNYLASTQTGNVNFKSKWHVRQHNQSVGIGPYGTPANETYNFAYASFGGEARLISKKFYLKSVAEMVLEYSAAVNDVIRVLALVDGHQYVLKTVYATEGGWQELKLDLCFDEEVQLEITAVAELPNRYVKIRKIRFINEEDVVSDFPVKTSCDKVISPDLSCGFQFDSCSWTMGNDTNDKLWKRGLSVSSKDSPVIRSETGKPIFFVPSVELDRQAVFYAPSFNLSQPSVLAMKYVKINPSKSSVLSLQYAHNDSVSVPLDIDDATVTNGKWPEYPLILNSTDRTNFTVLAKTGTNDVIAIDSFKLLPLSTDLTCDFSYTTCGWHDSSPQESWVRLEGKNVIGGVTFGSNEENSMISQPWSGMQSYQLSRFEIFNWRNFERPTSMSFDAMSTEGLKFVRIRALTSGDDGEIFRFVIKTFKASDFSSEWKNYVVPLCFSQKFRLIFEVAYANFDDSTAFGLKNIQVENENNISGSTPYVGKCYPQLKPDIKCDQLYDTCSWANKPMAGKTLAWQITNTEVQGMQPNNSGEAFSYVVSKLSGDEVYLDTPWFVLQEDTPITLVTNANSDAIETLELIVIDKHEEFTETKLNLTSDYEWIKQEIMLSNTKAIMLRLKVVFKEANAVFGLNSIDLNENDIGVGTISCNFENGQMCYWTNVDNQYYSDSTVDVSMDWRTVKRNEGPFSNWQAKSGQYFLMVDSNDRKKGDSVSRFILRDYIRLTEATKFGFAYYFQNINSGRNLVRLLAVDKENFQYELGRISQTPENANKWNNITFDLCMLGDFKIILEASFDGVPGAVTGLDSLVLYKEKQVVTYDDTEQDFWCENTKPTMSVCDFVTDMCSWKSTGRLAVSRVLSVEQTGPFALPSRAPDGGHFIMASADEREYGNDSMILTLSPWQGNASMQFSDAYEYDFNFYVASPGNGLGVISLLDGQGAEVSTVRYNEITNGLSFTSDEISENNWHMLTMKANRESFVNGLRLKINFTLPGQSVALWKMSFTKIPRTVSCDFTKNLRCGWSNAVSDVQWGFVSNEKVIFSANLGNGLIAQANNRLKGNSIARLISDEISLNSPTKLQLTFSETAFAGSTENPLTIGLLIDNHYYKLQTINEARNRERYQVETALCVPEKRFRIVIDAAFITPDSSTVLQNVVLVDEKTKTTGEPQTKACDEFLAANVVCDFAYGTCGWNSHGMNNTLSSFPATNEIPPPMDAGSKYFMSSKCGVKGEMTSALFYLKKRASLSFDMYQSGMGKGLKVLAVTASGQVINLHVFDDINFAYKNWQRVTIDQICVPEGFRLQILTGDCLDGVIAINNINFNENAIGPRSETMSCSEGDRVISCSFNNGTCGWSNARTNKFNWTTANELQIGSFFIDSNVPTDSFLVANNSGVNSDSVSVIKTEEFYLLENTNVKFSFNLNSPLIEKLQFTYVRSDSNTNEEPHNLWFASGQQSADWEESGFSFCVPSVNKPPRIRLSINALISGRSAGIGLDNLTLLNEDSVVRFAMPANPSGVTCPKEGSILGCTFAESEKNGMKVCDWNTQGNLQITSSTTEISNAQSGDSFIVLKPIHSGRRRRAVTAFKEAGSFTSPLINASQGIDFEFWYSLPHGGRIQLFTIDNNDAVISTELTKDVNAETGWKMVMVKNINNGGTDSKYKVKITISLMDDDTAIDNNYAAIDSFFVTRTFKAQSGGSTVSPITDTTVVTEPVEPVTPAPSNGGLTGAEIALIVVSCVLGLIFIGVLIVFIIIYKRRGGFGNLSFKGGVNIQPYRSSDTYRSRQISLKEMTGNSGSWKPDTSQNKTNDTAINRGISTVSSNEMERNVELQPTISRTLQTPDSERSDVRTPSPVTDVWTSGEGLDNEAFERDDGRTSEMKETKPTPTKRNGGGKTNIGFENNETGF